MVRYRTVLLATAATFMLGACAGRSTTPVTPAPAGGPQLPGATSAKAAVEDFMRAVNAQDLQQMATSWGTQKGPARDQFSRDDLEKRLIVIQCMLAHDSWSFAESTPRIIAGGRQEFMVNVRKKRLSARTTFTTVQGGPQQRWFVEIVDVDPLRDFCS